MIASSPAGWASEALLEGGVPIRECWEGVMGLHDQVGHRLSVVFCTTTDPDDYQADSDEERDFHAEEAGVLTGRWMRERDAIPAAEVLLPPEKVRIQANLVARSSDSQLRTCYGRTQTQQEWMSGG